MLSSPTSRNPLHTREITFQGYAREDGLWDIEAHLRDFKFHPFTTGGKTWEPGQAFHDMWVRITVNTELVIQAIEVAMDSHPHPECPQVIPPMDALIGARLGKGWRKTINEHLGGIKGCTHLRSAISLLLLFNRFRAPYLTRMTTNRRCIWEPANLGTLMGL